MEPADQYRIKVFEKFSTFKLGLQHIINENRRKNQVVAALLDGAFTLFALCRYLKGVVYSVAAAVVEVFISEEEERKEK